MEDKKEKQGLLKMLFTKKKSSCCSIEFEEIKDGAAGETPAKEASKPLGGCCCQPQIPKNNTSDNKK